VFVCVQEIKAHPFFAGVNWASLHSQTPPYVPRVEHELDTQNFERFDEDMTMNSPGGLPQRRTRHVAAVAEHMTDQATKRLHLVESCTGLLL
jgi:hypothetical protein